MGLWSWETDKRINSVLGTATRDSKVIPVVVKWNETMTREMFDILQEGNLCSNIAITNAKKIINEANFDKNDKKLEERYELIGGLISRLPSRLGDFIVRMRRGETKIQKEIKKHLHRRSITDCSPEMIADAIKALGIV